MKKIITFIAFIVLVCSFMFGCTPKKDSSADSSGATETPKKYEVINDFENYAECVQPLALLNNCGRADLNTDARFVKNGKGSLRLVPEGCKSEGDYAPILKQPLKNNVTGADFTDVSKLKFLSANVYSTADYEIEMTLELQFAGDYRNNPVKFTLKKGWNTVIYNVDPQIIAISYDVYDCKALLFAFDKSTTEKAPVLYVDDIRATYSKTEFTPIDMTVADGEICSFDKIFQQYVLVPNVRYPEFSPTLSINEDLAYVKSGKSLKVQTVANDGTFTGTNYAYTGFSLGKKYVNGLGLDKYPQDKYFSFWVYNSGSSTQRLFIQFFNYSGESYFKKTDIYVPANSWLQVKYKLSDLSNGTPSLTIANAGEIYINWELNSLHDNRVLYFDEFAIVD